MNNKSDFQSPEIYIIIINWNNYSDTLDCLESLVEINYGRKKLILVDNGSDDNSLDKIEEWAQGNTIKYKRINELEKYTDEDDVLLDIIALGKNMGFGGANNIGIQHALNNWADYVLLLNNDTVVTENILEELLKTVLASERTGMAGAKIKYMDNRDNVWFSGGYIDFLKGAFYHRKDDCGGQRESDFISGCLMLIPTEVIRKVGLFDTRYFLNVEDVDYSWRVKKAGYRLMVNCDALIYHKYSSTIGGMHSMRNQYYFHRNRMLFFSKWLKGMSKLLFFSFQFSVAIPAWMIMQLFRQRWYPVKGALSGYFDYIKGNFEKCNYL